MLGSRTSPHRTIPRFSADGSIILDLLPSAEEVQERRINLRYDALLHCTEDGTLQPHVSAFCDEVLMHDADINAVTIEKLKKAKSTDEERAGIASRRLLLYPQRMRTRS